MIAQPAVLGADLPSHILVASSSIWQGSNKALLVELCAKCLYQDQMGLPETAELLLDAARLPNSVEGAILVLAFTQDAEVSPEAVQMPLDQDSVLKITIAATFTAVLEQVESPLSSSS